MVDGSDAMIHKFHWRDVTGIVAEGGTVIGTARCKEFRTPEGRLKAAYNLISRGIDALVCIGGDGSLTGANLFRKDWTNMCKALVSQGTRT
jgi:6-phosphofructokinase 1